MMSKAADYAVVYDISSNKKRRQVSRLLKGFGFRIQQSVFECRLDNKGKRDLLKELRQLEVKTGFIKVYKLQHHFKPREIGCRKSSDIDDDSAFII